MICSAITAPVLLVTVDTGNTDWSASKAASVEAALAVLPRSRAEWFHGAHHDVHAQHPEAVALLLHRAVTEPDFFRSEVLPDVRSDDATRRPPT